MAVNKRKLKEVEEDSADEVTFPGIKIHILPQKIQKARLNILKAASRRKGFEIMENFNESVTHIVSQYDNQEKVIEALKGKCVKNVEIVNLSWLTACTTSGKPVPVTDGYRIMAMMQTRPSQNASCSSPEDCKDTTSKEAKYSCQKPTPLNHPNRVFTEALETLERHALFTDNSHSDKRALAFRRASCSLKALPKRVIGKEDVVHLNHVGWHSRKVIEEILDKGFCNEVEEIKKSDFFQAQENFSHIYGCGPATGRKWFENGYRTVDDLRQALKKLELKVNTQQQMGICYYEGVANGVTRKEADSITAIITRHLDDLEPGCTVQLVGGYRRGKPSGHDVDILVSHPDDSRIPCILPTLVQRLEQLGHIVHKDMSTGKNPLYQDRDSHSQHKISASRLMDNLDRCFCMFKMDTQKAEVIPDMVRRVDIIVVPHEQYPWALVGWTGSKQFNRDLRLYASKELNIVVSNHDAWDKNHTPPLKIKASSEKEIFDALNLTFLEPHDRNC